MDWKERMRIQGAAADGGVRVLLGRKLSTAACNRRKHRLLQVLEGLRRTGLKHEEKQVYGLLFNPSSFLALVQRS